MTRDRPRWGVLGGAFTKHATVCSRIDPQRRDVRRALHLSVMLNNVALKRAKLAQS